MVEIVVLVVGFVSILNLVLLIMVLIDLQRLKDIRVRVTTSGDPEIDEIRIK